MIGFQSCSTQHIDKGQYLLRKNTIKINSDNIIYNKGELKDNLLRLCYQKPNSYNTFGPFTLKLWLYNLRYKKLHPLPDSQLSKNVERPVLLDTATIAKSLFNMRSFLFNQGYFYAKISDTIVYTKKTANVVYKIDAGTNFLINKINYIIDDSSMLPLILKNESETYLTNNKVFTNSSLDEERIRLSNLMRNHGYYNFNQENIRFELDTLDKIYFKDIENPLENALNYIAANRSNKKPTLDIDVIIKSKLDSANKIFTIGKVVVYPDYSEKIHNEPNYALNKQVDNITFIYHDNYIHHQILADHIFIKPGNLYAQNDYDLTMAKLNELGIFQFIRIQTVENHAENTIDYYIYLNKSEKLDLNFNIIGSTGTNYNLGSSAVAGFKNKNFLKGANLLTINLNGGIEHNIIAKTDSTPLSFYLQTEYYGINGSVDFPKFIAPFFKTKFSNSNIPHTIVSGGSSIIRRVNTFVLMNTSASFKYNWRETKTKTWEFSPAFSNIIKLPEISDAFRQRLDTTSYLKSIYKETFIEGENITFYYNNSEQKQGKNILRIKIALEEAGGLLSGINSMSNKVGDAFKIQFAQYVKLDFEIWKYYNLRHAVIALRGFAGIGKPYGGSDEQRVLPYIKQYYVGGPYSLRGWRMRSLGPGNSFTQQTSTNTIDLTGDIKLESNGEYRFPIIPLFAGMVKMNGALFADAGNIWLANEDSSKKGGDFNWNTWTKAIAMDVGVGTRFDIANFLTLRLDVAMPIRKPYAPFLDVNKGWTFEQMDFKNSAWRKENLLLNLSIGYPF